MIRFIRSLVEELSVFILSYIGIVLWGFFVLGPLGFSPYELRALVILSSLLPTIFLFEGLIGNSFPRWNNKSKTYGMLTGFVLYVGFAIAYLRAMHEDISFSSNVKDLILVGLVLGVPSGLISRLIDRDAKEFILKKQSKRSAH